MESIQPFFVFFCGSIGSTSKSYRNEVTCWRLGFCYQRDSSRLSTPPRKPNGQKKPKIPMGLKPEIPKFQTHIFIGFKGFKTRGCFGVSFWHFVFFGLLVLQAPNMGAVFWCFESNLGECRPAIGKWMKILVITAARWGNLFVTIYSCILHLCTLYVYCVCIICYRCWNMLSWPVNLPPCKVPPCEIKP